MSGARGPDTATLNHRRLAIEFNQRTWTLLDNKRRSAQGAEEMVLAAHASLAHWLKAGTGVNYQRGQWLIARVYAELGRSEPALHHLRQTEMLTEEHRNELADFDIAFVEALAARIHALAGNHDRADFFEQLAEEPWYGLRRERREHLDRNE